MKKIFLKILTAAVLMAAGLLLFELSLIFLTSETKNTVNLLGNVYYKNPGEKYWHDLIKQATDNPRSYLEYNAALGWDIKKQYNLGLYKTNSDGIRSEKETDKNKPAGIVRIGLFGDSFTHGDQVPNNKTWAQVLEDELKSKNYDTEVLNFGVPGYGLDQAYLKYKNYGSQFDLDIAVIGLQTENIWRNLNVFRPVYSPATGIPFTKPRMYIKEGKPYWANLPPLPPDKAEEKLISDFKNSALFPYERFFTVDIFSDSRLNSFKTYIIFKSIYQEYLREKNFLKNKAEAELVSDKLLELFKNDAEAAGIKFMVMELPNTDDMEKMQKENRVVFGQYLEKIFNDYDLCFAHNILNGKNLTEIFYNHYTEQGNEIIGKTAADCVIKYYFNKEAVNKEI